MTDLLNAPHLAELEESIRESQPASLVPEGEVFTVAAAVERIRRIGYHRKVITDVNETVAAMLAPLEAEIARIKVWGEDERERPLGSIAYHEAWLSAYYRANPPTKGKTITLPGGSVSSRDQKPTWTFPDDDDALVAAVLAVRPELVKSDVVLKVNKVDLKREARVCDGKAFLVDGAGELRELPICVTEQPAKMTVEVEEVRAHA